MMVEEKCIYSASKENPAWTDCSTEARVTSQLLIYPLVEKFGIGRFTKNADKAKDALKDVVDRLRTKGELFTSAASKAASS